MIFVLIEDYDSISNYHYKRFHPTLMGDLKLIVQEVASGPISHSYPVKGAIKDTSLPLSLCYLFTYLQLAHIHIPFTSKKL
jgi:hypothetical protein